MQAWLTCYPRATGDVHTQYILLADFICWLSFLRATSERAAGQAAALPHHQLLSSVYPFT